MNSATRCPEADRASIGHGCTKQLTKVASSRDRNMKTKDLNDRRAVQIAESRCPRVLA